MCEKADEDPEGCGILALQTFGIRGVASKANRCHQWPIRWHQKLERRGIKANVKNLEGTNFAVE